MYYLIGGNTDNIGFSLKIAEAAIWLMVIYSSIIQPKFIQIPNTLVILGIFMVLFLLGGLKTSELSIKKLLTTEARLMLIFLLYMTLFGSIVSPNIDMHFSQLITTAEYTALMCGIIIIISKKKRYDSFIFLQLLIAIVYMIFLLADPVNLGNGQYSITNDTNPNGLGMSLTLGIWSILYFVSTKKTPIIIGAGGAALLLYGVFLTASRKAFIAAVLIFLFWVIFCYLPTIGQKGALRAVFSFLALVIIFSGLIVFAMSQYKGSVLAARMLKLSYEASEGSRSDMYRFGLKLFQAQPLFGYGFQGFRYYYGVYSHASLIEVPISGGIVGTLIYISTYLISIGKCIKLWWTTRRQPELNAEANIVRMLLVLWVAMLFYTASIIHMYQFDSFIIFGIIFGATRQVEYWVAAKQTSGTKVGNR